MIVRPHLHWFRLLFVWRGSVLPYIVSRLLLVLAVSTLSVLGRDWWMSAHAESALSIPPFTLMGIALAIFLGFRNSVSYDRYWEARKQWGALLIGARSLTREIVSFAPDEVELQRRVARTLAAFAFALKHQLRGTDPGRGCHPERDGPGQLGRGDRGAHRVDVDRVLRGLRRAPSRR